MEPEDRAYHRQMAIDLIRAYLREYGTEKKLARALRVEPPMISQYLHSEYDIWADLTVLPPELAEANLLRAQVPADVRAEQIAAELCTDDQRRDRLLHHLHAARRPLARQDASPTYLDPDELQHRLRDLGTRHERAMLSPVPVDARLGYDRVSEAASDLVPRIDPVRRVHDRAQVLLYLHDVACVRDRADLALGYARQAMMALDQRDESARDSWHERLRVNVALAEIVALNNLGLFPLAIKSIERAEQLPVYGDEPEYWQRSFLEQRLKAESGHPRFRIYDIEALAEQAIGLAPPGHGFAAGAVAYLVMAHIAYSRSIAAGSARSLRWAGRQVDDLRAMVQAEPTSTIRHLRILRAIAVYSQAIGDGATANKVLLQALALSATGELVHQYAEMTRLYRASPPRSRR